jgi:hypothetical protein
LIAIGRHLAGVGQKTTVLPPIVNHFDVVPGSLVCDVMLRTVPNGDTTLLENRTLN